MTWYKTGTIDVTNGSTSVIGASTEFVLNVKIGEALVAPNGELYEITGIVSNTELTISKPYDGATAINQTFEIVPTQSFIRDLAGQASQLLATIGQGKIGDGTAIDPGLKFANDLDTGIFRTGENAFGFSAGGVNVLEITQSGIQFQDINIAGNTVIGGNLTVQGTSTTLNTQELNVEDKNITVAFGAVDAVSANGAGLTVDGANATFTYTSIGDKWNLNKPLDVVGNVNATSFSIANQAITSSAIELNLLDGANVTTTEINHLIGVTSGIQGQLNVKAETLVDLGVTASIAEVNTLEGITATTAELNVLDGITATTAELNHTDGVTSNIQTQLNAKAPTANPTFTGTATIPNVDINGGNIDGTAIGASTPSTVASTNLSYTGTLTGGTGVINIGSGQVVKNANGNVGIGTTSPLSRLQVNINTTGSTFATDNLVAIGDTQEVAVGTGGGIKFGGVFTTGGAVNSDMAFIKASKENATSGNFSYALAFGTRISGLSPAERMRITASGNVGIGTSAPATKLHVVGESRLDNRVSIGGAPNTGYNTGLLLQVGVEDSATSGIMVRGVEGFLSFDIGVSGLGKGRIQYNNTSDFMGIFTNQAERMRITSAGNVGIGTSSPTPFLSGTNMTVDAVNTNGAEFVARRSGGGANLAMGVTSGNTGFLFSTTATPMVFGTNDTERLRIDSAGNVGIGTSSPATRLHIADTAQPKITIEDTTNTSFGRITAGGTTGSLTLEADFTNTKAGTVMAFNVDNTERARIDASGNLLVGTTDTGFNARQLIRFEATGTSTNGLAIWNGGGSGAVFAAFANSNGAFIGSVTQSGTTAVLFNTSSDYRLKEDAKPVLNPIDRLMQLKPINFAWKVDGSRTDGFLAHEAQAVVPEAVTGTKDAVDKDGKPVHQGIDQSKLVPLLTAALQDAIKRIEQLELQINSGV